MARSSLRDTSPAARVPVQTAYKPSAVFTVAVPDFRRMAVQGHLMKWTALGKKAPPAVEDKFGRARLARRSHARSLGGPALLGEMAQSIAQFFLAPHQIADNFLKVIAAFQCQRVTTVAHLLDNRIFERRGWLRVLRGYRLVGIHGLGFH
jgi:hypothetical protein